MIGLKDTGVRFVDNTHQYFLGDKELSGITGVLKSKLFPNMYKGIPQQMLSRAADKGSAVHEQIELVDTMGVTPSLPEVEAYVKMKKELGYETVANEYIVTDFDSYASGIDLVVHKKNAGDNEVELWDIKHTYSVHKAYVEWQLSIYKAWFEAINPELKVTATRCLWLRDDRTRGLIHQLIPLIPHTTDEVNHLFDCIRDGEPYGNDDGKPLALSTVEEYEDKVIFLTNSISEMQGELNAIKTRFMEDLKKSDRKKVDTGRIAVTVKSGGVSKSLDTKAFKEEDSALYESVMAKYSKEVRRADSVLITIAKET